LTLTRLFPSPENAGGLGGATRRDITLYRRAIRERWPITDDVRATVLTRLALVVDDTNASPRTVIAAVRALLQADRLNLVQEALDMKRGDETTTAADALAEVEQANRDYDSQRPAGAATEEVP